MGQLDYVLPADWSNKKVTVVGRDDEFEYLQLPDPGIEIRVPVGTAKVLLPAEPGPGLYLTASGEVLRRTNAPGDCTWEDLSKHIYGYDWPHVWERWCKGDMPVPLVPVPPVELPWAQMLANRAASVQIDPTTGQIHLVLDGRQYSMTWRILEPIVHALMAAYAVAKELRPEL